MLREAFKSRGSFPHGLYWTGMKGASASPAVSALLDEARAGGIDAHFVTVETYDAFMLRLWRSIENKDPRLNAKVCRTQIARVTIPLPPAGTRGPFVRLNALPLLGLPRTCQSLSFRNPKEWKDLRAAAFNTDGNLIFTKLDKVCCWGSKELLKDEFSDLVSVEPFDLSTKLADLENNTLLKAFLEEAIARALARRKPLIVKTDRSGAHLIADRHAGDHALLDPLHHVVGNPFGEIGGLFAPVTDEHPDPQKVAWAESLRVTMQIKDQKTWLLLAPNVWIWPRRARREAEEFLDKRRGDRFNDRYNALLDAWLSILVGDADRTAPIKIAPFESGSDAENPAFEFIARTGFARRAVA
jgi:hypothetical protein